MPAPHHSVFTGHMPFLPPNQQRQSTEGIKVPPEHTEQIQIQAHGTTGRHWSAVLLSPARHQFSMGSQTWDHRSVLISVSAALSQTPALLQDHTHIASGHLLCPFMSQLLLILTVPTHEWTAAYCCIFLSPKNVTLETGVHRRPAR